jgi:hypothetical protein
LFKKAIEKIAATVPTMPDEEPDADRRNADALLALTIGGAGPSKRQPEGSTTAEASTDTDPDRATVVVHVDLDALSHGDRCAEIAGGPVIAPEIASEMLCDCNLQVVCHDAMDRAVGISHESRIVPRWLRRQLMRRDRACTFPGCNEKRYLQAHHIVWWENGGPTQLDNLTMVCHHHHKLVHREGWSVVLNELEVAQWCRPDGTPYVPKVRIRQRIEDPEIETRSPIDLNVTTFRAERLRSAWVRAPGFV